ncbi:MAG: hypothetical protein ACFHXK_19515 [bacterium]
MDELHPDDQRWAEQAGRQLRAQEDLLAQGSQARLRSARGQAMQVGAEKSGPWLLWPAVSAGGVGAAALVWAVFLSMPVDRLPVLNEEEMAAAQHVELLEELEFVAWMLAEEGVTDAPSQG